MRESERKEYTKAVNAILEIHYTCRANKKCGTTCELYRISRCGLSNYTSVFSVPSLWDGEQKPIRIIADYCTARASCAVCLLQLKQLCPLQYKPTSWTVDSIVTKYKERMEKE